MRMELPSQEVLKSFVHYDPETGVFTWIVRKGGIKAGSIAGGCDARGYQKIQISGHQYMAHRLAWVYFYGKDPANEIDHINGNLSDNRIVNLRDVTTTENQWNQRSAHKNSKSGLLGVSPYKEKWMACIKINGKTKHLGFHATPEIAHAAYINAKRKHHATCSI